MAPAEHPPRQLKVRGGLVGGADLHVSLSLCYFSIHAYTCLICSYFVYVQTTFRPYSSNIAVDHVGQQGLHLAEFPAEDQHRLEHTDPVVEVLVEVA